jgi:hypothetical protein
MTSVVVSGRSECSTAALDGPAEWLAGVLDGRVDVWQVSEPRTQRDGSTWRV